MGPFVSSGLTPGTGRGACPVITKTTTINEHAMPETIRIPPPREWLSGRTGPGATGADGSYRLVDRGCTSATPESNRSPFRANWSRAGATSPTPTGVAGGEPDPSGHGGLGGGPRGSRGAAVELPAPGGRRPVGSRGSKAGGENGGKRRRKKTMVLDVDGLPVEVHGHPPGSEWNGYYRQDVPRVGGPAGD